MSLSLLLVAGVLSGSSDTLAEHMRVRGVSAADVVVAFAATPEMEAFAARTVAGMREPAERARRLYEVLREQKRLGRIVSDRDNTPKARAPKTAAELFAVMMGAAGDKNAGCYELTVLYIALARAAGLDSVGVERTDVVGTGQIGHVLAAVRTAAGRLLFDLQNDTRAPAYSVHEIDDATLAAHHYNHLSVAAYLVGDFARARAQIDYALLLAPDVPAFVGNRATTLAAQGEQHLALAEAARAVELAPALALYRYNLGHLLLASAEPAAAREQLAYALRLDPSYGLAHRDLGWAYLLLGNAASAERELTRAASARPEVADATLYLGLYHLARGNVGRAEELAKPGAARDKRLMALLSLARGEHKPGELGREVERLREVLATVQK